MKKLYFAIAFFVSFHVLDKSDGMNPEERRIRPMYTVSSSALVTNGGSRGVARMMTHNTRRPSPSRRRENVATGNVILETYISTARGIQVIKQDKDITKTSKLQLSKTAPMVANKQTKAKEVSPAKKDSDSNETQVTKTSKSQLDKTAPVPANKQTKVNEASSSAKKDSDSNNNLSRETPKAKAMTVQRPKTSTAVKANTQTKVNEVSPAKKDSGSSNRTQVVKQDEIKTSKSQLDKTAPMAVNKQTKVTEASPVKKNLDSNNSLSRETPEAKAMIARRPETSTAVRANTSLKQKVETSSSSLSPKSQNNNYKTETSAKMVPSMNQSKIAVTSAGTLSEQKRYGTALNHKTTNSNIATSSKRSQGNNPKSSVKPLSASTQNTGNMLSKVNSTSGTNSRKDLAKKNSGKYKTSTKEFTTTPQKQETLQQAKPKPPMAYETAKKLPAPMPEPEFIEVRIPVDHWNKSTWLREGYWDHNCRYETVRIRRGEPIPTRKVLNSDWSFREYCYSSSRPGGGCLLI